MPFSHEPVFLPVPLMCPVCARSAACTVEDTVGYALRGWPRCCGAEMTFIPEAEVKPSAGCREAGHPFQIATPA